MNAKEFLDLTEVKVPLTYPALAGEPIEITFYCKLALSGDDEAARQAFYKQPAGDMAAGQHAYNVDMLCRLMTKPPEGLPGFDDFIRDRIAAEHNATKDADDKSQLDVNSIQIGGIPAAQIVEHARAYLSDPGQMATKIANDAIGRYNRITQPDELFR